MAKKQSAVRQKHKKVIKNLSENIGKSTTEAMKEAGYSESYAKSGHITKTKTWKNTIADLFPEDLITKAHKAALNAKVVVKFRLAAEETKLPDHDTILKAVDMAYKLRGDYAPEKHQNVNPYSEMDDDELDAEIQRMQAELNLAEKKRATNSKK